MHIRAARAVWGGPCGAAPGLAAASGALSAEVAGLSVWTRSPGYWHPPGEASRPPCAEALCGFSSLYTPLWRARFLRVASPCSPLPAGSDAGLPRSRALRPGDCEVCVSYLGRFYQDLKDRDVTFSPSSIEKELIKFCREARGKENRLCYYIGATDDAATKIINEVSKPMAHHIPVEKICEKLKKKDSQICELKYDKQIDLSTVDLKKLRVKELKKVLDDWGETCKGCAEKSDYIRKINELMPKYAPKAASSRTDL